MKRPVWAIVPAKSWLHGKSRLRPALGDDDRALFAKGLLEHVLGVLGACALDGLLVATGGDDVASLAVASGAHVLWDANNGGGSLAAIVDRALAEVASRGAATALVLMADLPRIDAEDIRALLAALDDHDVALVRDHLGHHTNALAISPPRRWRQASVATTASPPTPPPRTPPVYASPSSRTTTSRSTWTSRPITSGSRRGDRQSKPEALVPREPVVAAEDRVGVAHLVEPIVLLGGWLTRERADHVVARAPLHGDPPRVPDRAP